MRRSGPRVLGDDEGEGCGPAPGLARGRERTRSRRPSTLVCRSARRLGLLVGTMAADRHREEAHRVASRCAEGVADAGWRARCQRAVGDTARGGRAVHRPAGRPLATARQDRGLQRRWVLDPSWRPPTPTRLDLAVIERCGRRPAVNPDGGCSAPPAVGSGRARSPGSGFLRATIAPSGPPSQRCGRRRDVEGSRMTGPQRGCPGHRASVSATASRRSTGREFGAHLVVIETPATHGRRR